MGASLAGDQRITSASDTWLAILLTLNEGRGRDPGDTLVNALALANVLDLTLNEGRGRDPGDSRHLADHLADQQFTVIA